MSPISNHPTVAHAILSRLQQELDRTHTPVPKNDIESNYNSDSSTLDPNSNLSSNKDNNNSNAHSGDIPVYEDGLEFKDIDPYLVTWKDASDKQNPRNWSAARKWTVTILVSLDAFTATFASSVLSPAMPAIAQQWHFTNNQTLAAMCVSIFILPWAFVPLVASPLSEIYGRRIILLGSLWVLLAFNIGCCFAQNRTQLIIFRFFAGAGGASPLSIGAGIIGDCFNTSQRNLALAIFGIGLILAPVVSPVVSAFVVQEKGWRWSLRVLVILTGAVLIANHLFLKESYAPAILQLKKNKIIKNIKKQAKDINNESGNEGAVDISTADKYNTVYDITEAHTTSLTKLHINIIRPLQLLFFHPMVYGLGIYLSFMNGFLYLMIVIFPKVWMFKYNFKTGISGLMFLSMGVGFIIGLVFWTWAIDYTVNKQINAAKAKHEATINKKVVIPDDADEKNSTDANNNNTTDTNDSNVTEGNKKGSSDAGANDFAANPATTTVDINSIHTTYFKPEFRLQTLLYGGIVGPASLMIFGWCVEKKVHWIVPSIFAAIFATAVVNTFQVINNYLIDMNPRFSASAVAAGTVFRSLFGFTFPLFAPKMYENLGYDWGNTMFFFIGIVLGVPYPVFAYFKGEKLREWGNMKIEKMNSKWHDLRIEGLVEELGFNVRDTDAGATGVEESDPEQVQHYVHHDNNEDASNAKGGDNSEEKAKQEPVVKSKEVDVGGADESPVISNTSNIN